VINTDQLQQVIGSDAIGPDGSKIGTIGQVYLDNVTGQPEWATVKTGLFGSNESFVPLSQAEVSGDGVRLPYDKDRIKGAPNIASDRELSETEEQELYTYYGLGGTYETGVETGVETGTVETSTYETGTTTGLADTDRETVGYDTSGPTTDDAMTRSEERVRAGTEKVEAGRARLRKYVVTEQQQVTVPVTREEVRVEREPITEGNYDAAMAGPDLSEEEHEVVLTEERAVIQKETVPVERVRLEKETVTEQETVNVDVREERIETDVDGGTTGTTGTDRL
jgi:uncharacterized protein (TIGR02271 family)